MYRHLCFLVPWAFLGCAHLDGAGKRQILPPKRVAKAKPESAQQKISLQLHDRANSDLKPVLEPMYAAYRVPGVTVGLVHNRQVVWTDKFGYANRDEKKPMTADTVTRIGSLTKIFTGLAILGLRDEGRLTLDDPVVSVIPELRRILYPSTDSPRITFRHLITHSSGLPRVGQLDYYSNPDQPVTVQALEKSLDGVQLVFSPGTATLYSNLAMGVASVAVDRLAGMPLRAYLEQKVFKPLGMTRTTFDNQDADRLGKATGYAPTPEGFTSQKPWALGVVEGMGGLYSTLNDMMRFLAWQTKAWPPRNADESGWPTRASLRESHLSLGGGEGKPLVGANWIISQHPRFGLKASHTGATQQYSAHITMFPKAGLGVVVLANMGIDSRKQGPPAVISIAQHIIEWLEATLPKPESKLSNALRVASESFMSIYGQPDEKAVRASFHQSFLASVPVTKMMAMFKGMRTDLGTCTIQPKKIVSPTQALFALQCAQKAFHLMMVVDAAKPHQIMGLTLKPAPAQ